MKTSPLFLLLFSLLNPLQAAAEPAAEKWADWQFLLGTWVAVDSSGVPGKASDGGTIFAADLQGAVLVRKNHATYPAGNGRPAVIHDDLMIFHRNGDKVRADYFDSEGHQIRYDATFDARTKTWTLISDAVAGAPRYRFIYMQTSLQELKLKFEIAPPNAPDAFKTYVNGVLKRQN